MIERCQLENKPAYRWGKKGKKFTYDPTSKISETRAKNRARDEGIKRGEYFREILDRLRKLKRK